LALPPEVKEEVAILQRRLKRFLQGDIRWVNPHGMHLTLKFFGGISGRQITVISEVVRGIAARAAPIDLQVSAVGAFPGVKRPRVIWLGIQGNVESLVRLQRDIDEKLLGCGFEAEERPFRPHLTLGRIKTPGTAPKLDAIVALGDEFPAACFTARELTLLKSELTPQGAVHTALASFPFGKR
jgi:2'-5' RNA ligase